MGQDPACTFYPGLSSKSFFTYNTTILIENTALRIISIKSEVIYASYVLSLLNTGNTIGNTDDKIIPKDLLWLTKKNRAFGLFVFLSSVLKRVVPF